MVFFYHNSILESLFMSHIWNLSSATSLALHTMVYIAQQHGKRVTTQEIADQFNVSAHHLAKVHQRLVKANLLSASRGPQGGFALSMPPEKLHLMQIYETMEGPVATATCFFDQPVCDRNSCLFGGLIHSVNQQINQYFSQTSLADLIERSN